jgi:hypothetical protein
MTPEARPVYCIVEGHGDEESVGVLVRRIAQEEGLPIPRIQHSRISRSALLRPDELERALRFARIRLGTSGALLILLDADDGCPADLATTLLARARATSDLDISIVLAKREFEAWFLAAAVSLRGRRGLATDLEPPADPESVRGAKEWLSRRMEGHPYSPPLDQPALCAKMDLDAARHSPSFDKCYREVTRLLGRGVRPESD